MKVLFLYPNVARARSPQVGLSSLAGTLKRQGHDSRLFDITFMEDAEVEASYSRVLSEYRPDLIGVSSRSTEWPTAVSILRMADVDVPVVVGGPHATIAPEEVIADERVDMLIRGEGEEAIIDLVDRLEAGSDLSDMPNLWVKQDGEIFRNDVRDLIQDMDSLTMPEWSIWDERHFREHYHQVFSPGAEVFGDLETSRGCPYACPYCLTPVMQKLYKGKGKYHREKSAPRIIEEIEKLRQEKDIDYVRFVDETFILNRKRLQEFCGLYQHIRLPFSFSTRPETVSDEMMKMLAQAGANCVSFGLESGNEQYRREMLNRKTKQQEVIDAVALARKYGVKTFAFVMIGLPHEDREKIQDTLELINLLQPDVFQITIFYPFEGTPFYDYCLEEGLMEKDHERLTEIWKGSVLNQPGLPSDYLIRLRELALAFAKRDQRWWPLMYYLEKHPPAFRVWHASRQARGLAGRGARKLLNMRSERRAALSGSGEK
ncbi:(Dimethylallyl)adenosine tRNA methylthiotransferase MiaB [bacterium BMS3Abin01]|nr:(Dimethylallyl)adenosine tRNA methylthiotransferase MiaB [bacterium BMS3Abin01]